MANSNSLNRNTVLDVGAAGSPVSSMLARRGAEVLAVDAEASAGELVEIGARTLGVSVEFACLGLLHVAGLRRGFDFVFVASLLERLPPFAACLSVVCPCRDCR